MVADMLQARTEFKTTFTPVKTGNVMASVGRFTARLLRNPAVLRAGRQWQQTARCSVVAGSAQHTLSVRKRIEDMKKAALLGGGQKRIDKQHEKVIH